MTLRFKTSCPCCGKTILVDADRKRLIPLGSGGDSDNPLDHAQELLEGDEVKRKQSFNKAFDEEQNKDLPRLEDLL